MVRGANLALKVAVAALAYWGTTIDGGAVGVLIAIAAGAAAVALWGRFAAPRSTHRLPTRARVPFELTVFALAVLALLDAGQTAPAVILATLAVANIALLALLDQWDR